MRFHGMCFPLCSETGRSNHRNDHVNHINRMYRYRKGWSVRATPRNGCRVSHSMKCTRRGYQDGAFNYEKVYIIHCAPEKEKINDLVKRFLVPKKVILNSAQKKPNLLISKRALAVQKYKKKEPLVIPKSKKNYKTSSSLLYRRLLYAQGRTLLFIAGQAPFPPDS